MNAGQQILKMMGVAGQQGGNLTQGPNMNVPKKTLITLENCNFKVFVLKMLKFVILGY